jgi:hypothetical protein
MKKRDRGLTPIRASLTAGWIEAVSETTEVKPDTASAFYLNGEGTSGNLKSKEIKSKDNVRTISNKNDLKTQSINISKKDDYRVPVQYPDGKPGMPTTNKRANKWIEEGKAETVKNKLNIFAIRLKFWPIYRELQPMVLLIDPGSTFTGMAVMSKKCINISYMLELPGYKRDSKHYTVEKMTKSGKIKKIERYHNTIVDRMTDRRVMRRGRRYRKCRRRECRFLDRSKKGKLAPSQLAKKQLELEMTKQLSNLYPISDIGFEDVALNHYKDVDGIKGQFFSQVEIGKNWSLERLKKIAPIHILKGYETNNRRISLKLPKGEDKTKRLIKSHVTDCIAMGTMVLNINNYPRNKFKFDIISRPKYSRRELFAKEPGKGGIFERYGGHIPNDYDVFKSLRKGDYVEARLPVKKKIFRGWISGYTGNRIYISNFDWKQFPSVSIDNIKLLDRNHGLISLRMSWNKDTVDVCEFGSKQVTVDGGNMIKIDKKPKVKEIPLNDHTTQRNIDDAWN